MLRINIHQAKTHLSAYLKRLRAGEVIVICNRNKPVAEIRSLPKPLGKRRPIGLEAGRLRVPESFFAPLPEEVIEAFSGGRR